MGTIPIWETHSGMKKKQGCSQDEQVVALMQKTTTGRNITSCAGDAARLTAIVCVCLVQELRSDGG